MNGKINTNHTQSPFLPVHLRRLNGCSGTVSLQPSMEVVHVYRMRHGPSHSISSGSFARRSDTSRLVRRQLEAGIDFLVPCGTTGESPTLTRDEHLRVVEITLEEAKGKVPVLAGAGGYNTDEVIELARELERWASTGFSPSLRITTSPLRKASTSTTEPSPPPSVSRSSFTTCRAAPASTSSPPPRAPRAIDNIFGIKEASGNIAQMAQLLQCASAISRPLRRRRNHASARRAWRTRRDLRRLQRNSRRDDQVARLVATILRGARRSTTNFSR